MLKTKICNRCGCEYEGGYKARYCPKCRREASRYSAKKRNLASMGGKAAAAKYATEKASTPKTEKVKQNICDSYCEGCVFLSMAHNHRCCNYFLATDTRRPCPAGKGCTVKMTMAQYIAEQKKKAKAARIMTIKCQICGAEFETTDKRRRNCSYECLQVSRNRAAKRQAERLKEARHG